MGRRGTRSDPSRITEWCAVVRGKEIQNAIATEIGHAVAGSCRANDWISKHVSRAIFDSLQITNKLFASTTVVGKVRESRHGVSTAIVHPARVAVELFELAS